MPKRNIIVTGVVACRIALGEGERAKGHCMGGGRSTFDMSHYDMNVLTYQVYIYIYIYNDVFSMHTEINTSYRTYIHKRTRVYCNYHP